MICRLSRRCVSLWLLIAALSIALSLRIAFGNERSAFFAVIEEMEWAVRNSPAHALIKELSNRTSVSHGWQPWAIIYVHVPRTGGDSAKTHLFPIGDMWQGTGWWGPGSIPRFWDELQRTDQLNWTSPRR